VPSIRLGQILLNLLSNARKLTKKGKAPLQRDRSEWIELAAVADSGSGMTAEQQSKPC
jgi:signal transduction histidine kinase